ncbi:MAG: hypothetical protein ACREUG_08085, partial [Steroidobacteraceae bacterium]
MRTRHRLEGRLAVLVILVFLSGASAAALLTRSLASPWLAIGIVGSSGLLPLLWIAHSTVRPLRRV